MSDQAEKALEIYLESMDYEETEDALFHGLRQAFLAGWEGVNKQTEKQKKRPNQEPKHNNSI